MDQEGFHAPQWLAVPPLYLLVSDERIRRF